MHLKGMRCVMQVSPPIIKLDPNQTVSVLFNVTNRNNILRDSSTPCGGYPGNYGWSYQCGGVRTQQQPLDFHSAPCHYVGDGGSNSGGGGDNGHGGGGGGNSGGGNSENDDSNVGPDKPRPGGGGYDNGNTGSGGTRLCMHIKYSTSNTNFENQVMSKLINTKKQRQLTLLLCLYRNSKIILYLTQVFGGIIEFTIRKGLVWSRKDLCFDFCQ